MSKTIATITNNLETIVVEPSTSKSIEPSNLLYLDTTAPNPNRRAHYAWIRQGGPNGKPLLPIRLDDDVQITGNRTTDDEWQARVALAQQLVDAWNRDAL